MNKGRAALYLRYRNLDDRARQLEELRACATTLGCEEEYIFEDQIKDSTRPALAALFEKAQERTFDFMLVTRIDRLEEEARSVENLARIIAILDAAGVRFIATGDALDSADTAGRFLIGARAAVAAAKVVIKSERLSDALKAAHEAGSPVGRPKTRDDELIAGLRERGLSLKQIAEKTGHSIWAVQRALRSG
ncbi:MAG: recombinase family protein [Bdellovibrionales bacterium]